MKRKAVLIIWRDAADHSPGEWSELPKHPKVNITTVGILVRKTRDHLLLCQSFDDNDDPLYRGVFSIPRTNVIEMRELSD